MGLDAVEILMGWEEAFGITITDAEATVLRTPRQSIDLIALKLDAQDGPQRACLTHRAFYHLRRSIMSVASIRRDRFRPDARLRDLVTTERRRTWAAIRSDCGISSLPGLGCFTPRTFGDLTRWVAVYAVAELKEPGEPWTRQEIRSVVRAVVTEVTGAENFEDDDDFIRDIGIG